MKGKAVFFDLDGTIIDYHGTISESTKKAIRQLTECGNLAVICTGRSKAIVREEEFLDLGFDGVIAGCGTYVEFRNELILNQLISVELLKKTIALLQENEMIPVLEGPEYLYYDRQGNDKKLHDYCDRMEMNYGYSIRSIIKSGDDLRVNKLSVKGIRECNLNVLVELKKDFYIIPHTTGLLELVPKGFHKGSGLQFLCHHLGISIDDTIVFGDGNNDLEMFECAGFSVAMGNGNDEIKKAADFVTTSIEEDGIYNGLEYLGLI